MSQTNFTNCLFTRNYAGTNGGAVSTYCSDVRFINCTLVDNLALGAGGAIFWAYVSSSFYPAQFDPDTQVLSVGNEAMYGDFIATDVMQLSTFINSTVVVSGQTSEPIIVEVGLRLGLEIFS